LITLGAAGCHSLRTNYVSEDRLDQGLVVSLDGIGGYNWGPRWIRSGFDEAGLSSAFLIYDWSKGPGAMFVGDLVADGRNHAAAEDLAQKVATYVAAKPGRPVTLIGHSGGGAVVVWALEAMPRNVRVERAILLAPALNPDYDLSKALEAVRGRLYVMYSYGDVGLMAAGTAVFGTMDRQHTVGAGLVGFRMPPAGADPAQYAKVRQVPWTLDLVKTGHMGGHMGWTTTLFARDFLAPILAGKTDPGQPLGAEEAPPAEPAQAGGTVRRPRPAAPAAAPEETPAPETRVPETPPEAPAPESPAP
jgi:pimeloyl-ACP methyl ester carboxylesterase